MDVKINELKVRRRKVIFAVAVFLIIALKYVLVNKTGVIRLNRNMEGLVSHFVLLPLLFAGIYYSLDVLLDSVREKRKVGSIFTDLNVYLSLPGFFTFLLIVGAVLYLIIEILLY